MRSSPDIPSDSFDDAPKKEMPLRSLDVPATTTAPELSYMVLSLFESALHAQNRQDWQIVRDGAEPTVESISELGPGQWQPTAAARIRNRAGSIYFWLRIRPAPNTVEVTLARRVETHNLYACIGCLSLIVVMGTFITVVAQNLTYSSSLKSQPLLGWVLGIFFGLFIVVMIANDVMHASLERIAKPYDPTVQHIAMVALSNALDTSVPFRGADPMPPEKATEQPNSRRRGRIV